MTTWHPDPGRRGDRFLNWTGPAEQKRPATSDNHRARYRKRAADPDRHDVACGAQEPRPCSRQAACLYSLIRPPRTSSRRIKSLVGGSRLASASGGEHFVGERCSRVRTVHVIVGLVLGQHVDELSLVEDRHPVQALASDRADPPLGVGVGLRRTRRARQDRDPASANTASKLAVNFASRSRTRNRNRSARSPNAYMRLRACWVTHSPVGCRVTPRMWTRRLPTSRTKNTVDPPRQHRVDGEEAACQHRRRLGEAELPPRRTAAPRRRVEARLWRMFLTLAAATP